MSLKAMCFSFFPAAFILLTLLSVNAHAGRTINDITLNDSSNVTVSPSETLSAVINVTVSGNEASDRWYSTEWTIGSETDCVNHDNHSDETANESFVVTVPAVPGIYDALFKVYGNDNCAENNNTQMSLPNAVEVVSVPVSMVVDYRFDELLWTGATGEVHDSSGNDYHATAVNGPTTDIVLPAIPGNPGTCGYGVFDGENDYVALPSNYPNITNSFTITAWIKTQDNARSGQRILIDDPNNSQGFGLSLGDGGTGRVRFYSRSTSPIILDTPNVVNNDTWYFVAGVADLDAKTKRIYVFDQPGNKIADVSGTYSGSWGFDVGDASMGGENDASGESSRNFHFQGNLDEIRVHEGALNESSIRGHQSRARFCFNQAAEYRFDLCSETQTVIDDSGNGFNGTVLNGPLAIRPGRVCNAAYFDGVDDYVVIDDKDAFDGTSALTIAGWINPEDIRKAPAGTNARGILSKRNNASSAVSYGIFFYSEKKDGKLYVDIDGTNNRFESNAVIQEGVWTHFAVVFDGSLPADQRVKLYLNGSLDKTANESSSMIPDYNSNLYIGNLYYGTSVLKVYKGLLDEIRIIPEVLSATDVQALMNYSRPGCLPCGGIDHIRIEHDGTGLTCAAETVTISACAVADCSENYTDEVTVNLTSPASGWRPNPVPFSGGSATVELRNTSVGPIILDAVAISPTVGNATQCTNSSGGPACEMVFADVGVLIDGDDSDADPESAIVAQIAGKPSNVSPPGPALQQRIRVVRTDDQTGACVAAVGNEVIDVTFRYLVPTPAEGLDDNTITVTGTTGANLAAAGSWETVPLAFDSNGTTSFHFVSADAGRYSLRVDLEIPVVDVDGNPVVDIDGNPTGETIAVSDTSNQFVVRPLAIYADATDNPKAQSATGDAYKNAGKNFPLTFKNLRWTPGRDGNNDGLWDDCDSSTLADPGTPLARVPAWIIGQPAVDLVLPAGGNTPDFSYADGNVAFVAGETEATANNVSYNEVGIVQLQADGMNTFLGESVAICSPYIGRFTPDHFTTTVLEQGVLEDGCSGFTYSGQPFSYVTGSFPEMLITARGQGGNQTLNYRDDFVKLTIPATQIIMLPAVEDVQVGALSAPMQVVWTPENSSLTPNNDGTLNFVLGADEFVYVKEENALIDKFVSSIRLAVSQITDSDGIVASNMPTHFSPVGTAIRYGRMALDNAYGTETLPLAIPIRTEYFNGSSFIPNNIDSCTPYASTYALLDDFSSPLSEGDTIVSGAGTLLNGALGTFTLSAPGVGKEGSLVLEYNLTTGGADLPWLQFDWEGDGSRLNPTARATFGIYKGNPRLIYMRESVW